MKHCLPLSLASGCLLASLLTVSAVDWPQYRGANGDGVSKEAVTLNWGAEGPKPLWKITTQNGFGSFAIAGGKAFIQVNREMDGAGREICLALDAKTGKELWTAIVGPAKYDGGGDDGAGDNKGGDGPRSTPTVNGGKVYVFTPPLVLVCLDAESGKTVWTRDLVQANGGRNIGWKNAASPVVDGDLVFVAGGGQGQAFLALNKNTGEPVWKGQDDQITHASPVVTTILGVRQVIFFSQSGLVSLNVKDGAPLWRFPFRYNVSTAASPVVAGDTVYCSAGYGVGGGACKITKTGDAFTATELWKKAGDKEVANHWSTPVYKDGYLYGMFSFKKYGTGPLKCVEVATGKVMWEQPGFGAGNIILVGNQIVALSDNGRVVIAEATPEAYKEKCTAKVLEGKCWSTPALSDGKLYVRSTKEGACLDFSK